MKLTIVIWDGQSLVISLQWINAAYTVLKLISDYQSTTGSMMPKLLIKTAHYFRPVERHSLGQPLKLVKVECS